MNKNYEESAPLFLCGLLLYGLCSMLPALPAAYADAVKDRFVELREDEEVQLGRRRTELKNMMLNLDRLRSEIGEDRLKGSDAFTAKSVRHFQGEKRLTPLDKRPEYYIEVGDVLEVDVWRAPDLTKAVTVRPDGRISMPLVGDLDVLGLTLIEARDAVTKRLSVYIRNPQVSISIRQFGGRKFIILGEVKSPGVYRYQQDVTVLEAIGLAGGFSEDARRGKIMIIRGDIKKEPQVKIISANMENVLKRGMISENLTVFSNDILFVGKDYIGDYKDLLENVVEPALDNLIDAMIFRSSIRTAQGRRN